MKKIEFVLVVMLSITECAMTQKLPKPSLVVPKGTEHSILRGDNHHDRLISIHPNGGVWMAVNNNLLCGEEKIKLPSHIQPKALCWTNASNLVLFSNDTIYTLDDSLILQPLALVEAKTIALQPYGETDFAFCAIGDTVVYGYNMKSDTALPIVSYNHPIIDFIVDDKDIFFASGSRVIAYLKEKEYLPVFQNENPIICIGFCGEASLLFSDKDGLWIVDRKRNAEAIYNQPVLDIITDSIGRGFFKNLDGSWLFIYPITNYEIPIK